MKLKKIIAASVLAVLLSLSAVGCAFGGSLSGDTSSNADPLSQSSLFESSEQISSSEVSSEILSESSLSVNTSSDASSSTASLISSPSGQAAAEKIRPGISDIVSNIEGCVVAINVTGVKYDYFNREYPTEGSGSGVIISQDGYIITNNHVISGGSKITVFLSDGRQFAATLIGKSADSDVALLKINATGLTAASIGTSGDLRVGDYVIAIGNPLGEFQGTVTDGIISGLARTITLSTGEQLNVLQTNAAVNPGNSGGGLFDYNGKLVGIVVAKTSDTGVEGLGFVLPIDEVIPVVQQLAEFGYVTGRAYTGVAFVDISDYLTARINNLDKLGVYVQSVDKSSPAAQAGLKVADYVDSINGTKITGASQAASLLNNLKIGDAVTMVIQRTSTEMTITFTVTEDKT